MSSFETEPLIILLNSKDRKLTGKAQEFRKREEGRRLARVSNN
ncbi:MAG: hypothetical protein ACFFB3_09780 [Candidatus Hodarchaeota archaeon]